MPYPRESGGESRDHAHFVETEVYEESGQWVVDIVVTFEDGVVRKRISTHHTERKALISADLIKRTAERDIGGPRFS